MAIAEFPQLIKLFQVTYVHVFVSQGTAKVVHDVKKASFIGFERGLCLKAGLSVPGERQMFHLDKQLFIP